MTGLLRIVGVILLLGGLAMVAVRYPTAPDVSWDFVHVFEFEDDECRALRESRETTLFVCPDSLEKAVTAGEVARRYNLELALLCRANELSPDCGGYRVAPGESLVLPLVRDRKDLVPPAPAGADR